jgi:hypothetical protein
VTRSTLARANEERDWRLFAELTHKLMDRVRRLYRDEPRVLDLAVPVYAVDSTLIDLSLALCPWANWTGTDAASEAAPLTRPARTIAGLRGDHQCRARRCGLARGTTANAVRVQLWSTISIHSHPTVAADFIGGSGPVA